MLETPIDTLPRTSAKTIAKLQKLGVHTYNDLLHYYPFRYDDLHEISPISLLRPNELVTIHGTVETMKNQRTRRGMYIQTCTIADETGKITITWFNQRYLAQIIKPEEQIAISGTVQPYRGALTIQPTAFEIINGNELIHTSRIVPVYPQTRGLSSKTIREKMWYILSLFQKEDIEELLPEKMIAAHRLMPLNQALVQIHFPSSQTLCKKARKRIGTDELFVRILASRLVKKDWEEQQVTQAMTIGSDVKKHVSTFITNLPFELTTAQKKVVKEITADLQKKKPMNRFLQGDVGSGKTIIAAIAACICALNGMQTLIMAPTEILARQHFQSLSTLFKDMDITIGLQTGSEKQLKTKKEIFDIVVGTHALITKSVSLERVGLVVIDEQHRFGVKQRAALREKGVHPHVLTMTATPIPRTVMLTLYSELDVSIIDEMPKGRKVIKTHVVPKVKRAAGYEWIKKQIAHGDQVYIVCPLVEETEAETMQSVRAATAEYEHLKNTVFKNQTLGLLHGKMKAKEKKEVMDRFRDGACDVLVCTSVVEVGVDVSNATIIVLEGAERFGMAQLHQLRGRVGRGEKQSYCLLFTSDEYNKPTERLVFFSKHDTGLELAEYDFRHRGPGEMHGTRQHGYDDLKIAELSNTKFVKEVSEMVGEFMINYKLSSYKKLEQIVQTYSIHQIAKD